MHIAYDNKQMTVNTFKNIQETGKDTYAKRNIGIEILRSLAMFMVIILHVLNFGINYEELVPFTVNWYCGWLLEGLSFCVVNIYAMISGYVMVKSKNKIARLLELWMEVFFYSVISVVIMRVITPENVGIIDIVKSFLPVCSQRFWYFTAYFLMFWFIPLFNWIINHLSFRQFRYLIFGLLGGVGCLSWISEILGASAFGVLNGYSALWLSVCYFIGAGLKIYGFRIISFRKKEHSVRYYGVMAVFSGLLTYFSKIILTVITTMLFGREVCTNVFYEYNSPLVIAEAIFLLCFFSQLKIKGGKWWIVIGRMTFGIYLIHQTQIFRNSVWHLFEKYANADGIIFVSAVLGGAALIFIVCLIIEWIRQKLFAICKVQRFAERFAFRLEKCVENFI